MTDCISIFLPPRLWPVVVCGEAVPAEALVGVVEAVLIAVVGGGGGQGDGGQEKGSKELRVEMSMNLKKYVYQFISFAGFKLSSKLTKY